MVEVFKTDVRNNKQAKPIIRKLAEHIPGSMVNFDLEDIDNILRVEADNICTENIVVLLESCGYNCEVLN